MPIFSLDNILHFRSISSTQDVARSLSPNHAGWTLVWADRQTEGQGRRGRDWHSQPGGLYYTLRYPGHDFECPPVYQLLVSAFGWIEVLGHRPGINARHLRLKWPNDLLYEGRKVCGLLAESVDDSIVLGVGLNVNNSIEEIQHQLDRPATSLVDETDEIMERRSLLFDWIRWYYSIANDSNEVPAPEQLEPVLETLGKRVRSKAGEGRAVGLDSNGGLILERGNRRFTIHSSELREVVG